MVAPTMVDVVRFTGGWLFDRVMAGWEALVLTADHTNSRPLRILGGCAFNLECGLTSPVREPRPQTIAVDADLWGSDTRVQRLVRDALEDGSIEVRLWSQGWPVARAGEAGSVPHKLSVAARAFKAQALAAAAAPISPVGGTEVFRTGDVLPSLSDAG